jgi:ABC-type dipeptide/oligopeptide/nickel transport system ATPase subunit
MLLLKSISIPYIAVAPSNVWQQEFALHKGFVVLINVASGKEKSSLVQTIYGLNNIFNDDILFYGKSSRNKPFVSLSSNYLCECQLTAYFCNLEE